MVGFYKHDIPAWMDGTEALSDGAYRAYHVILQLIMLNEGPIARNDRGIAGRCNQTLKTFSRNLAELIASRKLCVVDGKLDNGRAATELEAIRANRSNAAKGGRNSRKPEKISENPEKTSANLEKTQENSADQSAKSLGIDDTDGASLEGDVSLKEKRREDSPLVPKGTDARFERFRAAYPKRNVAFPTTQARKRYTEALKRGATPDEIEAGAKAYAAEQARIGKAGTEFVKTADVWLNQNRWRDYAQRSDGGAGAGGSGDAYLDRLSDDRWREYVRHWKTTLGQWDLSTRTPPPDHPQTKVPHHILAEFGIVPRSVHANSTERTPAAFAVAS